MEGKAGKLLSRGSTTSGGGLRSSHYVILLIYMFFAVSYDGQILTTGDSHGAGDKRKRDEETGNNHQAVVLEAIEATLEAYFSCKCSVFTKTSIQLLMKQLKRCRAKLDKVHVLQQKVCAEDETMIEEINISKGRKIHFMSHFADQECIQKYGAPSNFDTQSFEKGHTINTNGIWRQTSKR